jgi:hypothetical protein
MSIKRSSEQVSSEFAFPVRIRPIGGSDLAFVQSAMARTAPDWSVELQGRATDEATLVLLPEDGSDEAGPSFLVSREACGFRVDQVHWDVVTEIGVYPSIADVADVLRGRLAFCAGLMVPSSATIH